VIADLKPYAEYKDSGLPWLGMIPPHWSLQKLKHLTRFVNGLPFKPGSWCERGVPIIRIQNLNGSNNFNYTDRRDLPQELLIRPGDLLFAWSGNRGTSFGPTIWERDFPGYLNQHIFKLDGYSLDTRYFAYVLRAVTRNIEDEKTHGIIGLVHITKPELGTTQVPIASPGEQTAIVRFLDWANRRLVRTIRAKRTVIALLNEQKQAIIHHAVTRGLDPSVPLMPSGIPWLGNIPKHWEILRLKNVLVGHLTNGLFKRSDEFGSGVPLVNVSDIYASDGRIHKENLDKVRATPQEIKTFRVLGGDLFFVRSSLKLEGTGRCSLAESVDADTVFECHVVRARPNQLKIDPSFLAMFLSSWAGINNTISRANTVTISTLSQGAINSLPIALPPLDEQRGILELIKVDSSPITNTISRLEREIDLLLEYRTRLVADVVTGKLDVRAAAAKLPVEEQAIEPIELVEDDGEMIDDEITEPVG